MNSDFSLAHCHCWHIMVYELDWLLSLAGSTSPPITALKAAYVWLLLLRSIIILKSIYVDVSVRLCLSI